MSAQNPADLICGVWDGFRKYDLLGDKLDLSNKFSREPWVLMHNNMTVISDLVLQTLYTSLQHRRCCRVANEGYPEDARRHSKRDGGKKQRWEGKE